MSKQRKVLRRTRICTDGQTDGQRDGQTDGQRDGRTDGQTDGVTALLDLSSSLATQVKKVELC